MEHFLLELINLTHFVIYFLYPLFVLLTFALLAYFFKVIKINGEFFNFSKIKEKIEKNIKKIKDKKTIRKNFKKFKKSSINIIYNSNQHTQTNNLSTGDYIYYVRFYYNNDMKKIFLRIKEHKIISRNNNETKIDENSIYEDYIEMKHKIKNKFVCDYISEYYIEREKIIMEFSKKNWDDRLFLENLENRLYKSLKIFDVVDEYINKKNEK